MRTGHVNSVNMGFSGVYLPPTNGTDGFNGKQRQRAEQLRRELISEGNKAITHPVDIQCGGKGNATKRVYVVVTNEDIPVARAVAVQAATYQKLLSEYQELNSKLPRQAGRVPDVLLKKQLEIYQALDELQGLNKKLNKKCPDLERLFING